MRRERTGWLFRPSLELFAWKLPLPRGIVRSYFSARGVHIFVAVGRFSGRPSILFQLQFIAKFNMTSPLGLVLTPDRPELLRQICISYSARSTQFSLSLDIQKKNLLSINWFFRILHRFKIKNVDVYNRRSESLWKFDRYVSIVV